MATDMTTSNAIDNLFNDDFSDFGDDPFGGRPAIAETRDDKATLSPRSSMKRKFDDDEDKENALGLDEEVKIVKKRKPIAKLDEARLLSEPGLPVLRKLIREKQVTRKLRLKGKGNEFKDAARLLNYFQLWLDNLYPRAKFADALQLVEKAGHTKRMQMMRNEWINEGKPGYIRPETINLDVEVREDEMPDLFGSDNQNDSSNNNASTNRASLFGNGLKDDSMFIPDDNDFRPDEQEDNHEGPGDDELDALLAMQGNQQQTRRTTAITQDDSEGEDDLDALLAEQDSRHVPTKPANANISSGIQEHDGDDDDLDALLAENETREIHSPTTIGYRNQFVPGFDDEDEDDGDDLTTAIAAARSKPSNSGSIEQAATVDQVPQGESKSDAGQEGPIIEEGEDSQLKDLEADVLSSSPLPNDEE